jgi:lipoprotein-anchoring transpeptidase ErfK/SrfK
MTKGAVMTFERTHDMVVDPSLDSTLLDGVAGAREGVPGPDRDTHPIPYSYVLVREAKPETLVLYVDGQIVLRSMANTGVDNSTPLGTWPIYLRRSRQTLIGTYPNGESYDIPDVRDIDYFDGSFAVHGFPRASYGFPQSAGCVELPPAVGARLWGQVNYGTLVTVTS